MKFYSKETWKPIPGYNGSYEASSMGRIKSLGKDSGTLLKKRPKHDTIMKQYVSKTGYANVGLSKNGVCRQYRVHKLIAFAFIKNKNKYPYINHKDCNKLNNNISNLEWCTHLQNIRHAVRNGKFDNRKGEQHGYSKLKKKQVLFIRKSKIRSFKLAKKFNVTPQAIYRVRKFLTWTYI